MTAREVFNQSNGEVTKAYYAELATRGPIGKAAVALFRAQKTSTRAKKYSPKYRRMAYDTKSWSIDQLAEALEKLDMRHGWKQDPKTLFGEQPSWVFYVDLPLGQVSFHSPERGKGPDYAGEWDQEHKSEQRILAFCDHVMTAPHEQHRHLSLGR